MNIDPPRFFSALANETRLRCLYLVATNGEVCVCEIVEALGIGQPSASKALGALKRAGMVCDRREANWNYFRLNPSMPVWAAAVVEATVRGLDASPASSSDLERFRQLDLRGGNNRCV
jgi:ArsR family transcriptional regulator